MTRERVVLWALQGLLVGLPLLRGGRTPVAVVLGCATVVALLVATIRARAPRPAPGVGVLAAFVALALATTVPLPPLALRVLSPATARLYAEMLPGWPGDGGWSVWRPLALDPWGVTAEVSRLAIAFGAYTVAVAYPWSTVDGPDGDARERVFGRLVLTLVVGGIVVALLGLVQQVLGVLPLADTEALGGRASGPFVNPNHFAAWLEMTIPATLAYLAALAGRVRRRLARSAESGRGIGVRAGRAWISAVIVHQRRLWAPLVTLAALAVMTAAHVASGSRAGSAALLVGLAVTAGGLAARRRTGRRRVTAVALVAVLALASTVPVVAWMHAEGDEHVQAVDGVDASLGSRLAVAVAGVAVVRDHPLVGTGLGSWLHAFRPYQAPPVDGGIWDHAHDDYLELAAETGAAGVALALAFALVVVRAARRRPGTAVAPRSRPPGFEVPEWREALGERTVLRLGLAGGVAALLVHATLDFGLRMPANLVALMLILALLVLTGARRASGGGRAVHLLLATLVVAMLPALADALGGALGWPLSPARSLAAADLALAEAGDAERALVLARRALDRSPADRETHEMLARALGAGADGDAPLRRAIALNPWSSELRDRLAFRLWTRGEREAAADELAESMRRSPYLASHGFLGPDTTASEDPRQLVRVVVDGDTMEVRLAALEAPLAAAVERGLRDALGEAPAGEPRAAIVDDLVTLLEARERWADAAALLRDDADPGADGAVRLAHAARDWVRAGDHQAAEQALLTALLRTPERGELYRLLAVDVYGAQKDFDTAERVLHAGERSAVDILPVYEGVTQVLAQREAARFDDPAAP
jgi:hypothetical protein